MSTAHRRTAEQLRAYPGQRLERSAAPEGWAWPHRAWPFNPGCDPRYVVNLDILNREAYPGSLPYLRIEKQVFRLVDAALTGANGGQSIDLVQTQVAEAEGRFERTKGLYPSGEIGQEEYERELTRLTG